MDNKIEIDKIYNMDCMRYLDLLGDNSVDLTILDPNYNDWDKLCEEGLIEKAERVTKPTGNILMFTKQPFDYNLRNRINHIFRREIVWTFCNGNMWVSNKMPLVSFQKIYWCTLSQYFYFNERTGIGYSPTTQNHLRKEKVFGGYKGPGKEFVKSDDGIWIRDHLHYNKPNFGKIPAKPLDLLNILVRCFCPKDGVVLDPFVGSGNVCIAATKNNSHFIGFELDEECYKIAHRRIKEERQQLTLF